MSSLRQQLGVKRTCHEHGWIDAVDPMQTSSLTAQMACPTCALTAPIQVGTAAASVYCSQPVTLLVVTK